MSSPAHNPATLTRQQLTGWRNAVLVIFALCGVALSSWVARTPAIRDRLDATTAEMGWIIFGLAAGSIAGLTASSPVLTRFGPRRTMVGALLGGAAGLVLTGFGASVVGSAPVVVAGLVIVGCFVAACDVSMNVEGAANERALRRTVMPLFHASFSGGTIVGAGLGSLAEHVGLSVFLHLSIIAAALAVGVLLSVRSLQPHPDAAPAGATKSGFKERIAIWRDRRTLLIGLIVLGMAFAEGSANDWLALAMVDGHGVSNASGALIFGVFVAAMTVGRVAGVRVLDKFGRVSVLRGTAILAAIGLVIVIFAPTPIAVVGVAIWGVGASLGFPVGMSAAADDPATANLRVSAVATIGYMAFLVGPPVLGFLGDEIGLLKAFLLVLVLVAVAGLAAPAAREPRRTEQAVAPPATA